jgi:hypothetical protein
VIVWSASALLLMAFFAAPEQSARPEQRYQRVTVREQIVVRVPARNRQHVEPLVEWKEGKGQKCVPWRSVVGATLLGKDSVDFVLRGGPRVRAKLENSCPALDYYHGFYITPNADGRICADRDVLRSRMGGQCEIDRFRSLTPVAKR